MRQDWDGFATATFEADGTATAEITMTVNPGWSGVTVEGTSMSTTVGRSDPAKGYLYRDRVGGRLVGSTDRGGASSSVGSTRFKRGEILVAYWTGGTVGATAILYAEGFTRTPDDS